MFSFILVKRINFPLAKMRFFLNLMVSIWRSSIRIFFSSFLILSSSILSSMNFSFLSPLLKTNLVNHKLTVKTLKTLMSANDPRFSHKIRLNIKSCYMLLFSFVRCKTPTFVRLLKIECVWLIFR